MLETSQWHRTPSALCSQSQNPCPGGSNENKLSSHLPGEGLRGRLSPRATLLFMHLQPQLDLCLLCPFSRFPYSQAAAVYQHLLLPFRSWETWFGLFLKGSISDASPGSSRRKELGRRWGDEPPKEVNPLERKVGLGIDQDPGQPLSIPIIRTRLTSLKG